MAGQVEFMEAIQELERIAETNGNQLTMEEIRHYFAEMNLDETQYDFICQYYEGHKIHIIDRVEKVVEEVEEVETKADPLDAEMVAIYMKEAEKAPVLGDAEMKELLHRVAEGDEEARNLLIEGNLSLAIAIAKEYTGRGMQTSDLIQESNIGLMLAVASYEVASCEIDDSATTFTDYAANVMREQIEAALEEYNHSARSAMKMAARVNEMNEIATAFAKEHDREAKPEEIASRMGISEEEVRDLMKISLDAIGILDESNVGN